jgi:hypothetical protein
MRHIQLKKPRSISIRLPHILNRLATRRTQTIRQAQLAGYFCDGQFTLLVVYLVDADRREADGGRHAVAEDRGGSVPLVCVN